jgi:hypothetical protein
VSEPSAIEGVLQAIVDAMEAREAAEPDLPEWESAARLRAAEADLLALYRESARGGWSRSISRRLRSARRRSK